MFRLRPKTIEQGDGYRIVEFPIWTTESMLKQVASNIEKDAAIKGKPVKITVGHRLLRVDYLYDHRVEPNGKVVPV